MNDQKSTKNKLNSLMVVGWLMGLGDGVGVVVIFINMRVILLHMDICYGKNGEM